MPKDLDNIRTEGQNVMESDVKSYFDSVTAKDPMQARFGYAGNEVKGMIEEYEKKYLT